jgi:hypothetical protein
MGGINEYLANRSETKAADSLKEQARIQEQAKLAKQDQLFQATYDMVIAAGGTPEQGNAYGKAAVAGLKPDFGALTKDQPGLEDHNKFQDQLMKHVGKEFVVKNSAMRDIAEFAKQKTGFGDHALIFRYMKFLDPGSTIREGEFATVENTGSVATNVMQMYNRAIEGDKMTDQQRDELVTAVMAAYPAQAAAFEARMAPFKERAEHFGLNWDYISSPETMDLGGVFTTKIEKPKAEAPAAAPQAALDHLAANPETADDFEAKYGYLP